MTEAVHTLPRASYSWASLMSLPFFSTWIIRPRIGTVFPRTASTSSERPLCRSELIPLSDRARLMDLAKFNGIVSGSRRSSYQISLYCAISTNRTFAYLASNHRLRHCGLEQLHKEPQAIPLDRHQPQLFSGTCWPSWAAASRRKRGMCCCTTGQRGWP